jgi:hypothetical protein
VHHIHQERAAFKALVECGYVVLSTPSNTVTRPEFKTALDKNPSDRPFLFRPLQQTFMSRRKISRTSNLCHRRDFVTCSSLLITVRFQGCRPCILYKMWPNRYNYETPFTKLTMPQNALPGKCKLAVESCSPPRAHITHANIVMYNVFRLSPSSKNRKQGHTKGPHDEVTMNATNQAPTGLTEIRVSKSASVDTIVLILTAMLSFSETASLSTLNQVLPASLLNDPFPSQRDSPS